MKQFFMLLALSSLFVACSQKSNSTYIGTLVGVSSTSQGKACDFGTISLQPATVGGQIIYVSISDMTESRKTQLESQIGKKVVLNITQSNPVLGCSSSDFTVKEVVE